MVEEGTDTQSEAAFSLYTTASEDLVAASRPPPRTDVLHAQREMDRITGMVSSLLNGKDTEPEDEDGRGDAGNDRRRSMGDSLEHENRALREEISRLRRSTASSSQHSSPSKHGEEKKAASVVDWKKRAHELEKTLAGREKHFNTCISTINCLVAELKEIFDIRGFTAPGEVQRSNDDSVVSQLFRDISRLVKSLCFAQDGTNKPDDHMPVHVIEENKHLRFALTAAQTESKRLRDQLAALRRLKDSAKETEETMRTLKEDALRLRERNKQLDFDMQALGRDYHLSQDKLQAALKRLEERENAFQERAKDWETVLSRSTEESALIKAHADALSQALEAAREESRLQRLTAIKNEERAQALERENASLRATLEDKDREVFTARALGASKGERDTLRERSLILEELLAPSPAAPVGSVYSSSPRRTAQDRDGIRSVAARNSSSDNSRSSSTLLQSPLRDPLRASAFSTLLSPDVREASAAVRSDESAGLHLRMEDAGRRTLKDLEAEIANLQSSLRDML